MNFAVELEDVAVLETEINLPMSGLVGSSSLVHFPLEHIRKLNLAHNLIGDEGALLLSRAFVSPTVPLLELDLTCCSIGDVGFQALWSSLPTASSIRMAHNIVHQVPPASKLAWHCARSVDLSGNFIASDPSLLLFEWLPNLGVVNGVPRRVPATVAGPSVVMVAIVGAEKSGKTLLSRGLGRPVLPWSRAFSTLSKFIGGPPLTSPTLTPVATRVQLKGAGATSALWATLWDTASSDEANGSLPAQADILLAVYSAVDLLHSAPEQIVAALSKFSALADGTPSPHSGPLIVPVANLFSGDPAWTARRLDPAALVAKIFPGHVAVDCVTSFGIGELASALADLASTRRVNLSPREAALSRVPLGLAAPTLDVLERMWGGPKVGLARALALVGCFRPDVFGPAASAAAGVRPSSTAHPGPERAPDDDFPIGVAGECERPFPSLCPAPSGSAPASLPTRGRPQFLMQVFGGEGDSGGIEVVFVHGLEGHAINTWTTPSGVFWPSEWFGPDLSKSLGPSHPVRVWTFGFRNHALRFFFSMSARDRAATLAHDLACIEKRGPVVLVTHSMGGIIAKHLLDLRSDLGVAGVVFLGTPHSGTLYATFLWSLGLAGHAVKDLRPQQGLEELHARFLSTNIPWLSVKDLDVGEDALDLGRSGEVIPVECSHRAVAKPGSRWDLVYASCLRFAIRIIKDFDNNLQKT